MKKKILTPEMEDWLFKNYPNMGNQELAEQLTIMIRKNNVTRLNKLQELLPKITFAVPRNIILREIERINSFEGVSAEFVRHTAKRLVCPPKSSTYLSSIARNKAKVANLKKWTDKAVKVEDIRIYINSMRAREVRTCKVENEKEVQRFRSAVSRYNQTEGQFKGISICVKYFEEGQFIYLKAEQFVSSKHL